LINPTVACGRQYGRKLHQGCKSKCRRLAGDLGNFDRAAKLIRGFSPHENLEQISKRLIRDKPGLPEPKLERPDRTQPFGFRIFRS
jgi:hypothetical protein